MRVNSFLSALPALLSFAGFVLYRVLKANDAGDEISRRVLEKLRTSAAEELPPDGRLSPRQVARLLEHRQRLKELIGEQDFQLLKRALFQQNLKSVLVFALLLVFCGWSVYLYRTTTSEAGSIQTTSGDQSPNVNSSGSGPVTVEISPPEKAK